MQKERQKAAAVAASAAAATPGAGGAAGGQSPAPIPMALATRLPVAAQPTVQNLNPQMINAGVISSAGGQRFLIANNAQPQPNVQPGMIPNQGSNQQRVILAPAQQQRYFFPPSQP